MHAAVAMREVTFFSAMETMCAAPDSETCVNFREVAFVLESSLPRRRGDVENHRAVEGCVVFSDQGNEPVFRRRLTLGGIASCRDGATGSTELLVSAGKSKERGK